MPIDVQEVITLLSTLCDDDNLRVTVQESAKGGVIAGSSALIGGLLAGPLGIAAGGALGGMGAAYWSWGKFKSVGCVLQDMSQEQKHCLYGNIMNILNELSITDVITLNAMVATDAAMRTQLLNLVVHHVEKNLGMPIVHD